MHYRRGFLQSYPQDFVTKDFVLILAYLAIFVAQVSAGEGQDWTDFCGRWKIDIFDSVCGWVSAESLMLLDP